MYDFIVSNKDVLEIIIQALVAIGTCGAVIVSLLLANSQKKLKLTISFSNMKTTGKKNPYANDDIIDKEFVTLSIHNNGARPAILQSTNFFFDFKRKDKQISLILPFDMDFYSYPRTISWGETKQVFLLKYDEFLKDIVSDEEDFKNMHKFEAYYVAGTGEKIRAKIYKQHRENIIKDAKALMKKTNSRSE